MKHFYTFVFALFITGLGFGQSDIATIDRANGSTATSTGTATNISATGLTRGSGVSQASGSDYNSSGWSSDFATADANDEYYQWSLSANATFEIELTEFDIRLDRSNSGPGNWQIFYSLDNFATAGIDITGVETVGSSGSAFNFNTLSINSGTGGTITFRLYAWGASSGGGTFDIEGVPAWAGSLGVSDPGIRLIGNVNSASSNDTDTEAIAPSAQIAPATVTAANATTSGTAFNTFRFGIEDQGTVDLLPTNVTTMRFVPGPNNDTDWTDHIQSITIFDETNLTDPTTPLTNITITDNDITIDFDTPVAISDGMISEFVIGIFLNTTNIIDGSTIQLQIDATSSGFTADASGSDFENPFPSGDIVGNDITIDVIATSLVFSQQPPTSVTINTAMPDVIVEAQDTNGNVDSSFTSNVNITSTGTLDVSPVTEAAAAGIATYSTITHTAVGTGIELTATDGTLSVTSTMFDVEEPPATYNGVGVFEKITSLAELTDGYYVVAEANEGFAMNNTHNGTFLSRTTISPVADQITNPDVSIVWSIQTDGSGKTIFNEVTEEYVSYTGGSNNVQVVSNVTSNNQRWDFSLSSGDFLASNLAVNSRFLKYNPSAPRFACYTSGQRNLMLFKFVNTTPATTVQFETTSASVEETAGTYDLVIEIANEDAAATMFDVVLTSGDVADIDSYTTQSESFPGSSTTNVIVTVTITDDAIIETDEVFTFEIQNVAGGENAVVGTNNSFDLTILANDAPTPTLGWQITAEDTEFVIDFDTTVTGVNEGQFSGSGFVPIPATGQLDSDAWATTGMSDGSSDFGDSESAGDFARGTSTGGESSGGFYAFDTGGGNSTLGVQPTSSDWDLGDIVLKSQNRTGATMTSVTIEYTVYYNNNEDRSTAIGFYYGDDEDFINYTNIPELDVISPADEDSNSWTTEHRITTITGLNIADTEFFYLNWYGADNGGSGSRDEFAFDDIKVTFNPSAITYAYYDSWLPIDPNGVSTTSDIITVESGDATISSNTDAAAVTVKPGASLTVDAAATLTVADVTDGITLESTSSSYASLIRNGSINGTVNYERYVNQIASATTIGNDLISIPLTQFDLNFQSFLSFGNPENRDVIATNGDNTLHAFGPYDNENQQFINLNTYLPNDTPDPGAEQLISGKGYRAASTSGANITFTGNVLSTEVSIAITTPNNLNSQWNLIGNPYPSYIDAAKFLAANSGPMEDAAEAIYAYNSGTTYSSNAATTGNFTIINAATISAFPGENFNIAPGQGFFVPADITTNFSGDVTFTTGPTAAEDMRTTAGSDDYIAGRNSDLTYVLKLGLTTSSEVTTSFFFNENASRGLDAGYDAKAFGNIPIYSHLVEENTGLAMALQSLSISDLSGVSIPLGVKSNQGQQVTFSIALSTLPNSINVYLDDTESNTSTLLNISDCVITPNVNLNGTGRFYLRFGNSVLSAPEHTLDNLNIYTNKFDKTIVIAGQLLESTVANVYDIQGRKVISTALMTSRSSQTIDVSNLSLGVYVVQLQNATQTKTEKVIIR